jgi:hypothetical protein
MNINKNNEHSTTNNTKLHNRENSTLQVSKLCVEYFSDFATTAQVMLL